MSLAVDQNSLTLKGNSDMNLRLARNQFVLLELGVLAKDLSAGLEGNKKFCFLSTLMFLSASPRETLRVLGKKVIVSHGSSH